jgi:NAD(P)-dependent dehydrogenase (short-subunit alcohol dehydrogenase family)
MAFNPRLTDWSGKQVWVIGASSGIGRAVADLLYQRGASVVVSARNADALEQWVQERPVVPGLPRALALPLDVSRPESVQQAAHQVFERQPLDLLFYCAGHYSPMRAWEFDLAVAQQHVGVNYLGVLQVLSAALPALLKQGSGHLSMVSSVAGFRGLPQSLAYGPCKAALINLAETLYMDLHGTGLGVSVVNPGFVDTPMTAQNTFTMPGLITPQEAALATLQGWERGEFEIHYPKRFTRWMKLLRLLPYGWYFPCVKKFTGL